MTVKGTSRHNPGQSYAHWVKSELAYRLAACEIWYAVLVAACTVLLQLGFSSINLWNVFSIQSWLHVLSICGLHAALLLARHRLLSVTAVYRPWRRWLTLRWLSSSHLLVLLLHPLIAVCSTWNYASLAGFSSSTNQFIYGGVACFSLFLSFRSFICNEHVLRFPSLPRRRAARLRGSLHNVLIVSGRAALAFCLFWYVVHSLRCAGHVGRWRSEFFHSEGSVVERDLWEVNLDELDTLDTNARAAEKQAMEIVADPVELPALASVLHLFIITLLLALCWFLGRRLLEIFFTDPLEFDIYLLCALNDKHHPICKHLALQSLAQLVETPTRRILFDPQPYFLSPGSKTEAPCLRVLQLLLEPLDALTAKLYNEVHKYRGLQVPPTASCLGCCAPSAAQRCVELFADLQQLQWATQILSFLAVASIVDDRYGTMQLSLTKLLQSLLELSLAIEDYVQSARYLSLRKALSLQGRQLLRTSPAVLAATLDNALYRIVTRFFSQLNGITLPPKQAARLRAYISFSK